MSDDIADAQVRKCIINGVSKWEFVDPNSSIVLRQLIDMGFPGRCAEDALAACRGNMENALNLLLLQGESMLSDGSASTSLKESLPTEASSDDEITRGADSNKLVDDISKKKRKKKKPKRKGNNANRQLIAGDTNSQETSTRKKVNWGFVEEYLFSRDISFDTVPSKGLYPLGLGKYEGCVTVSVEEHIARSQDLLQERARLRGIDISAKLDDASRATQSQPISILETRQYDYRVGLNPLFHSVDEDER